MSLRITVVVAVLVFVVLTRHIISSNRSYNESRPSVTDVDQFFTSRGCSRSVVGETLQGHEIVLYEMDWYSDEYENDENDRDTNTLSSHRRGDPPGVLFLSLVHGNEPMGLLSVMAGADRLHRTNKRHHLGSSSSSTTTTSGSTLRNDDEGRSKIQHRHPTARVFFLPIVNVDAYVRNRSVPKGGERRSNARPTCDSSFLVFRASGNNDEDDDRRGGVDLNRNWPTGRVENDRARCSYDYPGPRALSEPETRTIERVAASAERNVVAALSAHSLKGRYRGRSMLIFPYTHETTSGDDAMPEADRRRFREWSARLSDGKSYRTGTAAETVGYSAAGTTIDHLYAAHNATAFVLEATPPCDGRWCVGADRHAAREHADTLRRFVELAAGRVPRSADDDNEYDGPHLPPPPIGGVLVAATVVAILVAVILRGRSSLSLFDLSSLTRRCLFAKVKDALPTDDDDDASSTLRAGERTTAVTNNNESSVSLRSNTTKASPS